MKTKITISKESLFMLMNSHSTLSQEEYERDDSFTSSHFAHKAEIEVLKCLSDKEAQEFYKYSECNMLRFGTYKEYLNENGG